LSGKPEGRRPLRKPAINVRIILKLIFKKSTEVWTGLIWHRIRKKWRVLVSAVMILPTPQNTGEFLDLMNYCQICKKDSALWSYTSCSLAGVGKHQQ
jgi:hypothetical protein